MATPRGSEHRDLEQRLRDIERKLRDVATVALRRPALGVTEGDFTVAGGGDVVIRDGGQMLNLYPDGATAMTVGVMTDETDAQIGAILQMLEEDGTDNVFTVYRVQPGHPTYPGGHSTLTAGLDDFMVAARKTLLINGPHGMIYDDGTAGMILSCATGISVVGATSFSNQVTAGGTTGLEAHNRIRYLGAPTTGSAANLHHDGTGDIRVVTSSERYKQDIEDAAVDPDAVLQLQGRTWRDRAEVADDPETDTRYVGYIAEELDALGLTDYVVYDDQGRPDAIQYDRLTVPLVALAQRQQAQIDALSARLDALEASGS